MYIISERLLQENCGSAPCLGTDALHQIIDVFGAWAFLPKALDEAVGSCPGESKELRHLVYREDDSKAVVADLVVDSVYVIKVEEIGQDYQRKYQTTETPVWKYSGNRQMD